MDFNDTKEEAKFREEVNSWLSANADKKEHAKDICLLYTSPSPRDNR